MVGGWWLAVEGWWLWNRLVIGGWWLAVGGHSPFTDPTNPKLPPQQAAYTRILMVRRRIMYRHSMSLADTHPPATLN